MSISIQEGLRPGFPLLDHADLVRTGMTWSGPVLSPREIPIHPKVFEADSTYTPDFALKILESIPGSVRKDVEVIEGLIKRDLGVHVTDSGIYENGREVSFGDFRISADPAHSDLGIEPRVSANAENTYIQRKRPVIIMPHNHPLPRKKLAAYFVKPDLERYQGEGMLTWTAHNSGGLSMANLLVLRNFAILANNLGLERLGQV